MVQRVATLALGACVCALAQGQAYPYSQPGAGSPPSAGNSPRLQLPGSTGPANHSPQGIGNVHYNPDGTITLQIGGTLYNSTGSTALKIGNRSKGSDGTDCQHVDGVQVCH